jgi:hypothetical protein
MPRPARREIVSRFARAPALNPSDVEVHRSWLVVAPAVCELNLKESHPLPSRDGRNSRRLPQAHFLPDNRCQRRRERVATRGTEPRQRTTQRQEVVCSWSIGPERASTGGRPYPLGAVPVGDSVNFAICLRHPSGAEPGLLRPGQPELLQSDRPAGGAVAVLRGRTRSSITARR